MTPSDTYTWLRSLNPPLDRYAGTLSRNGFETTFSMGLIEDEHTLSGIGIWMEDAERIMANLAGPRSLVAQWEPFLSHIPVQRISITEFLLMTPVPHLATHVPSFKAHGFDHISCFKNMDSKDLALMPSIPFGHKLAIARIAMAASTDCFTKLPSIDIDLGTWLAHLSPPMHKYESTLLLLTRKPAISIIELLQVSKADVMKLPMLLGHRKTLWHYIARERIHWLECLV
eukprot:GILI01008371.1.p2 GENE.GILI01008371.1~~GILI01008371.1.p2  ORF type:complete len:229 (+),score=17.07 GILI01008371.1:1081-1767(+)